jgi:hypothetical protein
MGSIAVDIFPPAYWQDFEKLTFDISKIEWNDDYAELHGINGVSVNISREFNMEGRKL